MPLGQVAWKQHGLKKILYLTDFSRPSRDALPFAVALAHRYEAAIRAVHVLKANRQGPRDPGTEGSLTLTDTETARAEMESLGLDFRDVIHQLRIMVRYENRIWPAVEEVLQSYGADLIVLGTHGRTGLAKHSLGSIAEEISRRSPVPVLSIGPKVRCGPCKEDGFRRLVLPTTLEPGWQVAMSYAFELAEENCARLLLLHVINGGLRDQENGGPAPMAELIRRLHETMPAETANSRRYESLVRYGEPAKQIIEVARIRDADLIVMGVRDHRADLEAATHFESTTAHKVIAGSPCPVLTIRNSPPSSDAEMRCSHASQGLFHRSQQPSRT